MNLSPQGLDFIKGFESFQSYSYYCPSGKLTIGYGHVILPNENIPHVTEQQALSLLANDVNPLESFINKSMAYSGYSLNQDQFDALVSLIFNTGISRFSGYKCYAYLKQQDFKNCLKEWSDIVRGEKNDPRTGKREILQGLVRRREAEIRMFNGSDLYLSEQDIKNLFVPLKAV